jgi:hypothetical protein
MTFTLFKVWTPQTFIKLQNIFSNLSSKIFLHTPCFSVSPETVPFHIFTVLLFWMTFLLLWTFWNILTPWSWAKNALLLNLPNFLGKTLIIPCSVLLQHLFPYLLQRILYCSWLSIYLLDCSSYRLGKDLPTLVQVAVFSSVLVHRTTQYMLVWNKWRIQAQSRQLLPTACIIEM